MVFPLNYSTHVKLAKMQKHHVIFHNKFTVSVTEKNVNLNNPQYSPDEPP
jgi:hypothetical protein